MYRPVWNWLLRNLNAILLTPMRMWLLPELMNYTLLKVNYLKADSSKVTPAIIRKLTHQNGLQFNGLAEN